MRIIPSVSCVFALCGPLLLVLSPNLQASPESANLPSEKHLVGRTATARPAAVSTIVLDISTRQPISGVLVREMASDQRTILQAPLTDDSGHVLLLATSSAQTPLLLHLSHPAYEPMVLRRPVARLAIDTIFMTPVVRELPGVTVRASDMKTTVLSMVRGKPRYVHALALLPDIAMATYLRAPTEPAIASAQSSPAGPMTISQVRVRFRPVPIREGGLRLRLLASPTPNGSTPPQGVDLMAPIELTSPLLAQAQASAEKGELIVDLSFANLTMPVNGVYVVFEALASKPGEHFVSVTTLGKESLVITGTDVKDPTTYSTSKLEEYPTIQTAETTEPSTSWAMGSNNLGWRLRVASAKGRYQHLLVSLVLNN